MAGNSRVVCIGEVLFDLLADRAGASLKAVDSWTPYPGGALANVACALSKLGTPVAFVGCVGTDAPGDELVRLLKRMGVDIGGVQRHPSAPTRQVYVLRDRNGERRFAGFGDRAAGGFADAFLQAEVLPEATFAAAEYLVLGTLELAYPETQKAIERALDLADKYFLKIAIDINWRPMFWPEPERAKPTIENLFSRVDFLKLSREEAQWLFGTQDPKEIAIALDSVEGVFVTAGPAGCSYFVNERRGELPAFAVLSEDTTGAGDGFFAGFLHQLCRWGMCCLEDERAIRHILRYASAVGAIATTRPGAIAAQPTAAEVETFLQQHRSSVRKSNDSE